MNNERGADLKLSTQITLEEAFSGCTKTVELSYSDKCLDCYCGEECNEICPVCNGQGQIMIAEKSLFTRVNKTCICENCNGIGRITRTVSGQMTKKCKTCHGQGYTCYKHTVQWVIPAGIDNGQSIRIRNKGLYGTGINEENRGDLLNTIFVAEHPVFKRNLYDLYLTQRISPKLAKKGGELTVKMIDGEIRLKIAPNTANNTKIRIKGKGMPTLTNEKVRGDCYLTVQY